MNEFELIDRLTRHFPSNGSVVAGPGDDCAVLDIGLPDHWLLLKTDAVVEGIHFDSETDPERVGHKALARVLSDIAAMGGQPGHAVVTLGLPPEPDVQRLEGIYRGMHRLSERFDVPVVGGETVSNPERMFISISMTGRVERGKAVLRSGAKEGDALFVTGELGGSIGGRHLDFVPRLEEGRFLNEHFDLHSMIDLSDGLAGDLRHIIKASGTGAELLSQFIPTSRAARLKARERSSSKPALLLALTDGEDYELLFSVAARDAVAVKDAWKERFPDVPLSCIGRITGTGKLKIQTDQGIREITENGYDHFKKS